MKQDDAVFCRALRQAESIFRSAQEYDAFARSVEGMAEKNPNAATQTAREFRSRVVQSYFLLAGAMLGRGGFVTPRELAFVKRISLVDFKLESAGEEYAMRYFAQGGSEEEQFERHAKNLYLVLQPYPKTLQSIFTSFVGMIQLQRMGVRELSLLKTILQVFQLPADLLHGVDGGSKSHAARRTPSGSRIGPKDGRKRQPTGDHFEILGLSSASSLRELKSRYRVLAKQFHPDMVVSQSRSVDAAQYAKYFFEIQQSYEYLLTKYEQRRSSNH